MPPPVITTLVTGQRAVDRETAIAARLPAPDPASAPVAVIIEGLADPHSPLAECPHVALHRIAPGCLCCAGNVVLRVTLNRLLRRPPAQLFISLADATHVGQLRAMLSAPPYDALLSLCDDVAAPALAS
ncbi:GTPase [Pseudoduganella lutea]|uniref:GTPase n=1 Tax=Pseudoduganella lutea TaxID=321985 RepID=A0A4P6KWH9_9BURK|nr:GTPase [Pseudoduganella lutea]QBE63085.1 GTPase [Pseudoduganella lutea]